MFVYTVDCKETLSATNREHTESISSSAFSLFWLIVLVSVLFFDTQQLSVTFSSPNDCTTPREPR